MIQRINIYKYLSFTVYALLLFYVAYRAFSLSFTHDESISYTIFIFNSSWIESANNHHLNTALMKFSYSLFGPSEFALRLPNVLAFFMYLVFVFQVFRDHKYKHIVLLGSLFLILNPFLLDFFSLARGYGLSVGFITGSVFFVFRAVNKYAGIKFLIKNYLLSFVFAALAVQASLSSINYYIAIILLFFVHFVVLISRERIVFNYINLFFVFLAFGFIYYTLDLFINRLLTLKDGLHLYFGGISLVHDTLTSLVHQSMYNSHYTTTMHNWMKYSVVVIFLAGIAFAVIRMKIYSRFFQVSFILSAMVSGYVLEHYLFDALYPQGRAALLLVPLFMFFIYFLIEELSSLLHRFEIFPLTIITVLLIMLFAWHFLRTMNFDHTYTWEYDKHTKDAILKINNLSNKMDIADKKLDISSHWLYQPTMNYYISSRGMEMIKPLNRQDIIAPAEFIYARDEDSLTVDTNYLLAIKVYPDTRTTLYKYNPPR